MKYTDLEGISNADIWLLMLWVQAEPARKKSFFEEESVSEIADKGIKKFCGTIFNFHLQTGRDFIDIPNTCS